MPEITFTTDHTYSPNGVDIVRASKGDTATVDADLAARLIARGVAGAAGAKRDDAPIENKAEKPAAAKTKTTTSRKRRTSKPD